MAIPCPARKGSSRRSWDWACEMVFGFLRAMMFPFSKMAGAMTTSPIRVEQYGAVAVLIPSPEAGTLAERPLEQAETAALAPLAEMPPAGIVMDLTQMDYFGS